MTMTPLSCRSRITRLATAALFTAAATLAQAHGFRAGDIDIGHPWARPTVPGQPVGGGYLKLTNKGSAADQLVAASVEPRIAERVELHTMRMDGNVMRMREVEAIEVPAGATVELAPGGLHLMLMGLKAPLKAGDRFPMTLRFQKAGEVKVEVHVEQAPAGAAAKPAAQDHPQHGHKH